MNAYLISIGLVVGLFYGGLLHRLGVLGLLINAISIIMIMDNQLASEHIQTWMILGCVIGNRMEVNSFSIIKIIFAWLLEKGTQMISDHTKPRQRRSSKQISSKPSQSKSKSPDNLWNELKK